MNSNPILAHWLKRLGATTLVLTTLALWACGGSSDETVEIEGPVNGTVNGVAASTVEVQLTDFALDMKNSVPAGQTIFRVTNRGEKDSDFKIEGNGLDEALKGISAGETKTIQVDLRPGTYTVSHTEIDRTLQLNVTERKESMPPVNGQGTIHTPRDTTMSVPPRDTSGTRAPEVGIGAASRPATPMPVEVQLTDSDITVPGSVVAGEKTFKVTNSSKDVQTFKITGTGLDKPVEIARLNAGESRTIQVNLKPGTYKVVFGLTRELQVTP
jgi:hypothetical protein